MIPGHILIQGQFIMRCDADAKLRPCHHPNMTTSFYGSHARFRDGGCQESPPTMITVEEFWDAFTGTCRMFLSLLARGCQFMHCLILDVGRA